MKYLYRTYIWFARQLHAGTLSQLRQRLREESVDESKAGKHTAAAQLLQSLCLCRQDEPRKHPRTSKDRSSGRGQGLCRGSTLGIQVSL